MPFVDYRGHEPCTLNDRNCGGGITGLAAAYELTARGMPFQLFEASPRLAGIRTDMSMGSRLKPVRFAPGAQTCGVEVRVARLGQTLSTTPPRTEFVMKHGHLYPLLRVRARYPNHLARHHRVQLRRLRRAASRLETLIPPRRDAGDESVGAFFNGALAARQSISCEPFSGHSRGDVEALSMTALFPVLSRRSQRRQRPALVTHNFHVAGDGFPIAGGALRAREALERRMRRIYPLQRTGRRYRQGWQSLDVSARDNRNRARRHHRPPARVASD